MKEMKAVLRSRAPAWVLPTTRSACNVVVASLLRGAAVRCPLCSGTFSKFARFNGRADARCPRCSSLERHRLLWLFLERQTDVFTRPQRVLHIAPEPYLRQRLAAAHGAMYTQGDISDPESPIDVTRLDFPDATFDVVICSHVFEHVADDGRAIAEVRRVLRPTGWAILDAPVDESRDVTYEDTSIASPGERRREFGQWDHVRTYGRDYVDRLRAGGFDVQLDSFEPGVGEAKKWGLRPGKDRIYFCRPRAKERPIQPMHSPTATKGRGPVDPAAAESLAN